MWFSGYAKPHFFFILQDAALIEVGFFVMYEADVARLSLRGRFSFSKRHPLFLQTNLV
jgi:hypothetical protein